ncbi:FtsW/RodA/SpoVE family cell cycle protein [Lysinibacillus sp. BPa_S21]|uniref:FtsW/RodA/SpoVE family cell cycle protein n=1 Tax=Lysinibacillus sp. BPa_S21 TaxID=2932478 RepID=UPI002012D100|nr:FtsW/RodA/SpoVE family cell cycle protein [Lysinibacillus sp. BPa_S21]MCL1698189.1 FtsW/RodA/SpoVE family cell cycle protein [Lysinibacillus sp. BPa_S21]
MRTIKEFTQHVKGHIRNKEAHDAVEKELTYHLAKSKHAWQEKGYKATDAELRAVREMGNATNLGVSLNQIHQPKIDWLLVIPFMLAVMCSFLPLLPAELSLRDSIIRNIVIVIGGIVLTIFLMRLDFRKLERYSTQMYILGCLLFLIILNGNETINGVVFFRVGPLELKGWMTMPLFLIAFAGLFAKQKKPLWLLLTLYLIGSYCYLRLPDISLFCSYSAIVATLFYASSFSRKQKLAITIAFSLLFVAFICYLMFAPLKSYQLERMQTIFRTDLDENSIVALSSTVMKHLTWFGTSSQPFANAAHTDFALLTILQTYGILAGVIIICILGFIIYRLAHTLGYIHNEYGRLLITGGLAYVTTQIAYQILMLFGLVPFISMPLPFISHGVFPMLIGSVPIGLTLSIYRRKSYI